MNTNTSNNQAKESTVHRLPVEERKIFFSLQSKIDKQQTEGDKNALLKTLLNRKDIKLEIRQALAFTFYYLDVATKWGFRNFFSEELQFLVQVHMITHDDFKKSYFNALMKNPHMEWQVIRQVTQQQPGGHNPISQEQVDYFVANLPDSVMTDEILYNLLQDQNYADQNRELFSQRVINLSGLRNTRVTKDIIIDRVRRRLGINESLPESWVWKAFGIDYWDGTLDPLKL